MLHAAAGTCSCANSKPRCSSSESSYSYRTEVAYVDRARRFLAYLTDTQAAAYPQVTADGARDYLTHLAVRRRLSPSTQNRALAAILLLCRDVLGVQIDGLADAVKAKRGSRLPVVLRVPEVAALLTRRRRPAASPA